MQNRNPLYKSLSSLVLLLVFCTSSLWAQSPFSEVSTELGIEHSYPYNIPGPAGGLSFVDFDQDGWDDLTLSSIEGETVKFYRNIQGTFEEVTFDGLESNDESKHVIWVDYDNDGDLDFYVSNTKSPNQLFRNEGDFTFINISESAGLPVDDYQSYGCSWLDINRDGYLDLFQCNQKNDAEVAINQLLMNQGDGTFLLAEEELMDIDRDHASFCSIVLDTSNDGWPDIFVANDRLKGNFLYRNRGPFGLENFSAFSNTNREMNAMGMSLADLNADGLFDFYVSNDPSGNALHINSGDDIFLEQAADWGIAYNNVSWGSQFFDFDNDGDQDLYVSSNQYDSDLGSSSGFFLNNGSLIFSEATSTYFPADNAISAANALGDFNRDGALDLAALNRDPEGLFLWQNPSSTNDWIRIDLESFWSNKQGIGARIQVESSNGIVSKYVNCGSSFLGQNSQHLLLGLGTLDDPNLQIEVEWPSGYHTTHSALANTDVLLSENDGNLEAQLGIETSFSAGICHEKALLLHAGVMSHQLEYAWSTGDTSPWILVDEPGNYALEVSIQGEVLFTDSFEASSLAPINISSSQVDNICPDDLMGMIEVESDDDITYYWSNGSHENTIGALVSGDYSFLGLAETGCETSLNFQILPEHFLVSEVIDTEAIQLEITGGTPPYSIEENGVISSIETFSIETSAVPFAVQISDALNCTLDYIIEGDEPIGLTGEFDAFDFDLYPNPTKGFLFIRFHEAQSLVQLNMTNLLGQEMKVQSQFIDPLQLRLNLEGFNPGLYLLNVKLEKKDFNIPIMVR